MCLTILEAVSYQIQCDWTFLEYEHEKYWILSLFTQLIYFKCYFVTLVKYPSSWGFSDFLKNMLGTSSSLLRDNQNPK